MATIGERVAALRARWAAGEIDKDEIERELLALAGERAGARAKAEAVARSLIGEIPPAVAGDVRAVAGDVRAVAAGPGMPAGFPWGRLLRATAAFCDAWDRDAPEGG